MILQTSLAIIGAIIGSFAVFAEPTSLVSLVSKTNKHCSEKTPCSITQKKNKNSYQISVVYKEEKDMDDEPILFIDEVKIKALGKKETQNFAFKNTDIENDIQGIDPNEELGLYALDVNSDGFLDIALNASDSLKESSLFYYWLYNPKKKKFVRTYEQIPELKFKAKGFYNSAVSSKTFKITSDYKIVPLRK